MAVHACFLDASTLVSAFDPAADEHARTAARTLLEPALADTESAIAFSPLMLYEVTRAVEPDTERVRQLLQALDGFTRFDITERMASLDAELFRQERANAVAARMSVCRRDVSPVFGRFDRSPFSTNASHR